MILIFSQVWVTLAFIIHLDIFFEVYEIVILVCGIIAIRLFLLVVIDPQIHVLLVATSGMLQKAVSSVTCWYKSSYLAVAVRIIQVYIKRTGLALWNANLFCQKVIFINFYFHSGFCGFSFRNCPVKWRWHKLKPTSYWCNSIY